MSGARNHTHSVSEANVCSCGGELDYTSDEISRVRRLIRREMCLLVYTSCLAHLCISDCTLLTANEFCIYAYEYAYMHICIFIYIRIKSLFVCVRYVHVRSLHL